MGPGLWFTKIILLLEKLQRGALHLRTQLNAESLPQPEPHQLSRPMSLIPLEACPALHLSGAPSPSRLSRRLYWLFPYKPIVVRELD